jgi:acetyl-CoA acetyltransferase
MSLSNKAAIAGLGQTEFSVASGRSEMQLALEAITAALADSGLTTADVDGMATYTADKNDETDLHYNLGGQDLKLFVKSDYGGGAACAPLLHAAMAVATGVCQTVICYRAMNERSAYRFGAGTGGPRASSSGSFAQLHTIQGIRTPAASIGMLIRRYMHETGARSEDFGLVAVSARKHASTNPLARFYGKPITLEDHQASRMIVDPLRLLDCCQESDGAVALVITSAERARDLRQRPVLIRGGSQGISPRHFSMYSYYQDDISNAADAALVGREVFRQSGLSPADIDLAILYDHFGPSVMMQLEAYGFCSRGEAKDFIKGGNIEVGGGLPVNTNGGQVGEAYIHGMNGIAEAVRQLRGTASNQVAGARNALVTAGIGVPTSGVVLGVD